MLQTDWAVLTPAKSTLLGAPPVLVKNMMAMGMWQDTPAGTSGHPWGLPIGAILVGLEMLVLCPVSPFIIITY